MTQRDKSDQFKVELLTFYCAHIINLRAAPDPDYVPVPPPGTPDDALDADKDLSQTTQGPNSPTSAASQQSASAASPAAPIASPPAAAASSTHNTRGGRPAVKAAGGKEAQQHAREADRLLHDRKPQQARQLLAEELSTGQPHVSDITPEYAAKQAKTAVNQLFENASPVRRPTLAEAARTPDLDPGHAAPTLALASGWLRSSQTLH